MELRLNRFLAQAGVSSRRRADELVREGRVQVNGVRVTTQGLRVDPAVDRVTVDGAEVGIQPIIFCGALHKPRGVLTTLEDPFGRADLRPLLAKIPVRVYPVGRLDVDSEGLLLVTNDGDLSYRLMHPKYAVEKEYEIDASGGLAADGLQRLLRGVELEDGLARAKRAVVVREVHGGVILRITLTEGRNREVRRMAGAIGLGIRRLVRIRVGTVRLGDLAPGAWRELGPGEMAALRKLTGLEAR